MEDIILELKVKSLIELRTSIIALIILTGGTAGLFFLKNSPLKYCLLFVGVFYLITFISNLDHTMKEINKLLSSKE